MLRRFVNINGTPVYIMELFIGRSDEIVIYYKITIDIVSRFI